MHYLLISFSHKNSTIEIREKLSYPDNEHKHGCLTKLNSSDAINETILISTCNRMEVLCSCEDLAQATDHIFNTLSMKAQIGVEELEGRADVFEGSTAIHHVFAVASSLDSMVIGETQIAGQLKDAFRFSHDNGYCGKKLARTIKSAFKAAARVRSMTGISEKPVSMASVAVAQLKSLVNDMTNKKALVIGVGEMSEITAKNLVNAGADVYITNRTGHKADALAKEVGCQTVPFEELSRVINEYEILFTATSSNEPIINDDIIHSCDFDRYWFDLAMPRDISFHKGERINLYVIDDLQPIVEENLSHREDASKMAHGIIGRSVVEFFESLAALDIEPIIKEIYKKAYKSAAQESQRVITKGFIPKEYEEQAQKMCEQALKRFLHEMTSSMRNSNEDATSDISTHMMSIFSKSIENEKQQIPDFIKEKLEKK